MRVVGLSGGVNSATEQRFPERSAYAHDSAAVLIEAGRLIAASEEERHLRWKHTTKRPGNAIASCLAQAGIRAEQVDRWAYFIGEDGFDRALAHACLHDPELPDIGGRELLARTLSEALAVEIPGERLDFVPHHLAHALSAFELSGFESSLVVSYDGGGDDGHGKVFDVRSGRYELLATMPKQASLGQFYARAIAWLGYSRFDEYKVMGLAPYGDPERYLPELRRVYELRPQGEVAIDLAAIDSLALGPRRARGAEFDRHHADVAAAIQRALEELAFHVIGAWRAATGQRRLCLAGGVALNCSFNGKLGERGWFDEMFVQPAPHDAGAALGAALHSYREHALGTRGGAPIEPLAHVFTGTPCPSDAELERLLARWSELVTFERCPDPPEQAAELLAAGKVIAWFQGRSEFGPRALGNRSILADPRPAANKHRVNAMIKKREAYRPFAPSVLEERAAEFFELPLPAKTYRYMGVVAKVVPEQRELLGAITHVDGSARLQTVCRATNPRYWALIDAFGRRTGVPIVLNTSFNNFAEPIVDSPSDALTCFVTTGLDHLILGGFLVSKRGARPELAALIPSLPHYARLVGDALELALGRGSVLPLAAPLAAALRAADGERSLAELLASQADASLDTALADAVLELWQQRAIRLEPR